MALGGVRARVRLGRRGGRRRRARRLGVRRGGTDTRLAAGTGESHTHPTGCATSTLAIRLYI